MTDKLCRETPKRQLAKQISNLLSETGIPKSFTLLEKLKLILFKYASVLFSTINLAKKAIRKEFKSLVIDYDEKTFDKKLTRLSKQDLNININHLGEEVLGEDHAKQYLSKIIHSIESLIAVLYQSNCRLYIVNYPYSLAGNTRNWY